MEVWVVEFRNSQTGQFEPTEDLLLSRSDAEERLKWWSDYWPGGWHRIRRYVPAESEE